MLKSLKRHVTGLILPGKRKRAFARVLVLLVLLGGWTFLCKGAWQLWLADWPWIRLVVAVLMFALPGIFLQHFAYKEQPVGVARYLTLGFAISVALTGLLGLVASVAHFSFRFVTGGLFAAGGIGLFALIVKGVSLPKKRIGIRTQAWAIVSVLPALMAIILTARLCSPTDITQDDFTYVAYITHFEHSESLSFNDIFFGLDHQVPSRFWLAFWPLTEAIIAHNSQLHGLELTSIYLGPVLAALCLLGVFEVARAVGLSRRVAYLALVAQFASLSLLTYPDQAGHVFFNRLTEDKVVAAFVLTPVMLRLVVDSLNSSNWHSLALLALVGLGLACTHPTMVVLACLISALYAVLSLATLRRVKRFTLLLCVLVTILMAPFSLRFGTARSRRLPFTLEGVEISPSHTARLEVIEGTVFYGINPASVRDISFGVVVIAGVLALLQRRRNPAARYVLASVALIAGAVVPYTGWLLGLVITPFQLWRVPWLTPFGVSTAFLVSSSLIWALHKRPQIRWDQTRVTRAVSLSAQLLLLLLICLAYVRPTSMRAHLDSTTRVVSWPPLHDLISIGTRLDVLIPTRAVVVGSDHRTNNFIPGLSAKAEMVVFRNEHQTMAFGGFSEQEVTNRWDAWEEMVGPDTPAVERLSALIDYKVKFVLLRGDPPMQSLVTRYPERFELVGRSGRLLLYKVVYDN